MAVVGTNSGAVLIDDLPKIPGFNWHQFIEVWPRSARHVNDDNVDYHQYDGDIFRNIKVYIGMLDMHVRENIRSVYNCTCIESDICPIIFEEDTIFHLVKILNSCNLKTQSNFNCVWKIIQCK